ncbi:phosphoribosyl-AMP cyclohydrolase [Candidatus Falkowbacteria bacterium]|nr:phosphoribosyl-AMP cyclohydrolase [Candidatus Falkowbacteria bacterium]
MKPDFEKGGGLVVAIVQDSRTNEVLMQAYMSESAWQKTLETGQAWFWSRSRCCLWQKGEESGNVMTVMNIYLDCDFDAVLLRVRVEGEGVACHKGRCSCFVHFATKDSLNSFDFFPNIC